MAIIVNHERFTHSQDISVYREHGSCQTVRRFSSVDSEEMLPVDSDDVYLSVSFDIYKVHSEDQQLVSGWANVALDANGEAPLDWQDDVISPETLVKAAMQFMMDYRVGGEMHEGNYKGADLETIVHTE